MPDRNEVYNTTEEANEPVDPCPQQSRNNGPSGQDIDEFMLILVEYWYLFLLPLFFLLSEPACMYVARVKKTNHDGRARSTTPPYSTSGHQRRRLPASSTQQYCIAATTSDAALSN